MSAVVIDHIQALIDARYTLRAWRERCGHHKVLDLQKLGERLGFDHSTMHDNLTPKLRCDRCGGRKIGLTLSYGKPEAKPFSGNANSWR